MTGRNLLYKKDPFLSLLKFSSSYWISFSKSPFKPLYILLPKLSDFSLFITSKILDSCFRRNDDYHPIKENVIPVKTGIQKGLYLIIILIIAQFRYYKLKKEII